MVTRAGDGPRVRKRRSGAGAGRGHCSGARRVGVRSGWKKSGAMRALPATLAALATPLSWPPLVIRSPCDRCLPDRTCAATPSHPPRLGDGTTDAPSQRRGGGRALLRRCGSRGSDRTAPGHESGSRQPSRERVFERAWPVPGRGRSPSPPAPHSDTSSTGAATPPGPGLRPVSPRARGAAGSPARTRARRRLRTARAAR